MSFNFIIGRYWNGINGSICVYTIANNSNHYGTSVEAESMLGYVNDREEDVYQIFKIEEL